MSRAIVAAISLAAIIAIAVGVLYLFVSILPEPSAGTPDPYVSTISCTGNLSDGNEPKPTPCPLYVTGVRK